jgi:hypothetical protein
VERKDALDLRPRSEGMVDALSKLVRLLELPGLEQGHEEKDQENRSCGADAEQAPGTSAAMGGMLY